MRTALRHVAGGAIAAALLLFIVTFSRRPWTAVEGTDAELRLAWRFKGERVTDCRRVSAEELAKLPPHMRRETVCEPRLRPYRLEVAVDGRTVAEDTVRPRGARADRPLGVFVRIPVGPGARRVRVAFGGLGEGARSPLMLDTVVVMRERRIVLVTYSEEQGLVTRAR